MYTRTYEHPIKRVARRAVQEFFLCWLAGAIAVAVLFHNFDWLLCAVAGFIVSVPLLILYRLVRFAANI